jgi:drug/metabolite transporter (DMT)-like permease
MARLAEVDAPRWTGRGNCGHGRGGGRGAEETAPLWLRLAPAIFLLLWSGGFPVGKVGIGYAGPMTFLSIRYALVLLVLAPLLALLRPPMPRGDQLRHLLVVGVLVQGSTSAWAMPRSRSASRPAPPP